MPGAGLMRDRVAFDSIAAGTDDYGNPSKDWQEQFEVAAQIRYLRGGETVVAQRLQGAQPAVVTIRDCFDARAITPGWRARDVRRGTVFNVRAATPTDDRMFIDLLCEAGVAT
jgi:SPP1 family predicted phage head-tail adaptor